MVRGSHACSVSHHSQQLAGLPEVDSRLVRGSSTRPSTRRCCACCPTFLEPGLPAASHQIICASALGKLPDVARSIADHEMRHGAAKRGRLPHAPQ